VKLTRASSQPDVTTIVTLTALTVWFAVSVVASRFNPGPDWFDSSDWARVAAFLLGVVAAVSCAGTAAGWMRLRMSIPRPPVPVSIQARRGAAESATAPRRSA